MDLLIIEGVDNVGKNHIINRVINESHVKNFIIRHFLGPPPGEDPVKFQQKKFLSEFQLYQSLSDNRSFDSSLMIWNRSHLGEYVYGNMYRNADPSYWLFQMERDYIKKEKTKLVLLYADPEFVISKDDGLSFTTDLEKKKMEIDLFNEAFDRSHITNKQKFKMNVGYSWINCSPILDFIKQ